MCGSWMCKNCDTKNFYETANFYDIKNFYEEIKVCLSCGEKIDSESVARCSYEFAEQFYGEAVTSNDFFILSEYYSRALNYKDGRSKYNKCQFHAQNILVNEKVYNEAVQRLEKAEEYNIAKKWADAECEFTAAEQQFEKIPGFMDSDRKIEICRQEKDLCRSKQIYFSAKAILSVASCIEDYKKAAGLFNEILTFSDAQKNYDVCLNFIDKLTAEKQLEEIIRDKQSATKADLDKKIEIYDRIVKLKHSALSKEATEIILQTRDELDECLKRKHDIELQRDLENIKKKYDAVEGVSDYKVRLQMLEGILTDYKGYSQTPEFSQLLDACREKFYEADRIVSYDNASELMDKATDISGLKKAAEIFSVLGDFKDSQQKKEECLKKSKIMIDESIYKMAVKAYEEGCRVSIFNWRKNK